MRSISFLALTAALLAACAPAPRETQVPVPAREEVVTASGSWDFTMWDGEGNVLGGRMIIQADGSGRISVPQQGIDSVVEDGELVETDGAFTWQGSISTPFGTLPFVMSGEMGADEVSAENVVEGLAILELSARRVGGQ